MKLLTCEYEHEELVCVLTAEGKGCIPVRSLGLPYADMSQLIECATDEILQYIDKHAHNKDEENIIPLSNIKFLAPIPHPMQDVLCMGLNYMEHTEEVAKMKNMDEPEERVYPIYFAKHVDRARGHEESIPSHADFISTLDYECELGVITRKDAYKVPMAEVEKYIFGYTIIDDISGRELSKHKQNFFQKSLDGACPMGPWIVTADEFKKYGFPPKIFIKTWVNGEQRQNGSTKDIMFDVDEIIHDLSQGVTIKAASILATGSPKGIGASMNPPQFLKSGDVIKHEIEGIGVLVTHVE